MAQNQKRAAKQQTRAQRRAAEEAAARVAAEKAEKERRQQTIIGIIAVAIVVVLVAVGGFAIWRSVSKTAEENAKANMSISDAYSAVQKASTKPERADEKGGILLSKDGYGKSVDGAPTIGIYMDFICPGCGQVNRELDPTLIKMVNAGQINLELHFLSFMDSYSTDDYSSRAANSALYIADHDDDPDHLLTYVSNLYAEDFQPEEGTQNYQSVSDDKLKEQAVKAGVSQAVADKAYGRDYQDWLDAMNVYTPKRTELQHSSGTYQGQFTTPTITINGTRWDTTQLSTAKMGITDGFAAAIGLDSSKIGTEGTLPSIGSSDKPISLTTGE
ncbi:MULTISPECIES: DsbA family protein [Bifidobacterium]|uniref:DsbA family protein n=1 Tax=Bifidobacterium TaxID=1678 RepID=UPI001BDC1E67|nr:MULTISPECIES: thioredoxin domain-containing protein [Bifidobacterium]MBT1162259.1 thioredoxin domain-containing protein [Bifidobacterium sp. SO1]MBW3079170.1 thioredoxin domain-containing protein [Bifidobacterium simiiventris]